MIAFFLSPIGKYLGILVGAVMLLGGVYTKGVYDGRSAYKAKIERQVKDAINKGSEARERALRELDAGKLPDDWFRD